MQQIKHILPPQTIGIVGGGQLGRMMAIAAKQMGYRIVVLDPTPNCPAAQIADQQIEAAYDDMDAISALTRQSDVITYEFENVDLHAATYMVKKGKLPQGAYPLEITQNREKEKQFMKQLGLPVPRFAIVTNAEECQNAFEHVPLPAVIKTCHGGYDGKGQLLVEELADKEKAAAFAEKHQHCIVEQWIRFDKEISVIFTRGTTGQITFFPLAENEHRTHILHKTIAPANVSDKVKEQAYAATRKLAEAMDIVGTFAIEMFVEGETIFLNEMAPRPHNSGHYTIEGCNISQFSQHVRAICGLPLIPVQPLQCAVMVNILGEAMDKVVSVMPQLSDGFIHLYGKAQAKRKRKMGHITFIADTVEQLNEQLSMLEEEIQ
ncbi:MULTISPECIES: 5-(carboxyamino)imidazole ribonucleotide synthase [unclassified Virgibacillus]|uniref:5-(carboxyamino)imidazole ribonucleotide synthase n=1 Tax=unclassified Virgibacillus TaxID=2620237 RepID=UPI0024DE1210|nr:5-(carboxyamino)imidazole ribonucleotide synthase [Virgibacillus sp. LDC-1]